MDKPNCRYINIPLDLSPRDLEQYRTRMREQGYERYHRYDTDTCECWSISAEKWEALVARRRRVPQWEPIRNDKAVTIDDIAAALNRSVARFNSGETYRETREPMIVVSPEEWRMINELGARADQEAK